MSKPIKLSHLLMAVAGIVGAIGGGALSQYCGAFIWIPGAAMILLLLLFTKGPIRPKRFAGAIAATVAHVTWFIVGSIVARNWSANALDIIALAAGIIWLWWCPSLPAALFLGLVQLASLALNIYFITSVPFGSTPHRALTAHCVIRLIAITCLVVGYWRMRRDRSPPPTVPTAVTP